MIDPLLAVGTTVMLSKDLDPILIIGKRGCSKGTAFDYMGVNAEKGYIPNEMDSITYFNAMDIHNVLEPEKPPTTDSEGGDEIE